MIEHFLDRVGNLSDPTKPWMIVGKGPSAERWNDTMRAGYNTIGINQAARRFRTDFAAFIDYEPFIQVGADISRKATVIMPWVPHWRERSGHGNLETYLRFDETLQKLETDGALLSYDLRTTEEKNWPCYEVVQAYASTTESVVHLLALHGVRKIFTLGIDGGTGRARDFETSYRTVEGDYSLQDYGLNLLKAKYNLEVVKL